MLKKSWYQIIGEAETQNGPQDSNAGADHHSYRAKAVPPYFDDPEPDLSREFYDLSMATCLMPL